eukprot:2595512-Pyramimonas_sp.AAC.1
MSVFSPFAPAASSSAGTQPRSPPPPLASSAASAAPANKRAQAEVKVSSSDANEAANHITSSFYGSSCASNTAGAPQTPQRPNEC